MVKVLIKKVKGSSDKVSDELKVDLRNNNSINGQKKPSRKWFFLSILLFIIVILASIGWRLSISKKAPFVDLIPEKTVIYSLIDQENLYNQASPFYQFLTENNFYFQPAIAKISYYLAQVGLDFKKDVQPFFKSQAAFILMPNNNETSFPFILIFEKKLPLDGFDKALSKIEQNLKNDYNFSIQFYRQIKMTILNPLVFTASGFPDLYVYAQVEDYFIITNSQESIKEIIDNIVNN